MKAKNDRVERENKRAGNTIEALSSGILAHVLSFLWFNEHAIVATVNISFREVCRSESLGKSMLQRLLFSLNQPLFGPIVLNADTGILLRRLSTFPTAVDTVSLNHTQGPRNISVIPSDTISGDQRVIYQGGRKDNNRSKAFAVVVSDDHFPCLLSTFTQPRFKNEIKLQNQGWVRPPKDVSGGKAELQKAIIRSIAPFAKVVRTKESDHILTLSCVAYFEAQIYQGNGDSTGLSNSSSKPMSSTSLGMNDTPLMSLDDPSSGSNCLLGNNNVQPYQLQLSIGLACALFPLRKRRPGFDKNSFGYHGDGRIYHANRNSIQTAPPFAAGDVVGCGIMYPPLGKHHGKLFFTKNGMLVAVLDIGVGGLLSLPWFPVVCLAPGIPMEFNFGIQRSFLFDVMTFEEQHLMEIFGSQQADVQSPASSVAHFSGTSLSSHHSSSSSSSHGHSNHSSPLSLVPRGDPWSYYKALATEQENKQWTPRHPKYRNNQWDFNLKVNLGNRIPPSSAPSSSSRPGAAGTATTAGGGGSVTTSTDKNKTTTKRLRSGSIDLLDDSMLFNVHVATSGGMDEGTSSRASSNAGSRRNSIGDSGAPSSGTTRVGTPKSPPSAGKRGTNSLTTASLQRTYSEETQEKGETGSVKDSREGKDKDRKGGGGGGGGGGKNDQKTSRDRSKYRRRSLFLDSDLREATLLEISHTSRPAMGGSDASWEGTGEEDSEDEEEEDDDEELASTCGQDAGSQDEWGGYGGAVCPVIPLGVPLSYAELEEREEDDEMDPIAHHNYSERYHGHTMTHSAGLFELAQNHSSAGWTAGDLASTLSVKTVTMKGGLRRGGGRGSGSARSRTGGSEMGEWDTEERDGWCADSMSMAVECSDDADEEDDLKTVIEEEQALNNLKNVHVIAGVTAPLSMRPPEGFTSRRRTGNTHPRPHPTHPQVPDDSLAMAPTNGNSGIVSSVNNGNNMQEGNARSPSPTLRGLGDLNMTLPEFMGLASVVPGVHSDWMQRVAGGAVGQSISSSTSAMAASMLLQRGGDHTLDDENDSIATSLFVEVASVDECGSYIGYGGAGDSEDEDDEDDDEDRFSQASRNGTLSHSLSGRPVGWGVNGGPPDADEESFSVEGDKYASGGSGCGSGGHRVYSNGSAPGLLGGFYGPNLRVMWDPDCDGYDGASERGRCETDGVDDLGTDGEGVEVGEEMEGENDQYSTGSGSGSGIDGLGSGSIGGGADSDGNYSNSTNTKRIHALNGRASAGPSMTTFTWSIRIPSVISLIHEPVLHLVLLSMAGLAASGISVRRGSNNSNNIGSITSPTATSSAGALADSSSVPGGSGSGSIPSSSSRRSGYKRHRSKRHHPYRRETGATSKETEVDNLSTLDRNNPFPLLPSSLSSTRRSVDDHSTNSASLEPPL